MLLIGIALVPLIIKRKLAEMKCASVLLFAGIGVFVLLFAIQLCTVGNIENHDESYGKYYHATFDFNLVTGINIMLFAVGYQITLFPTMDSLGKDQVATQGMKVVSVALGLMFPIYLSVAILSIYTFGSDLDTSVLVNVGKEGNAYALIIQATFLVVIGIHIPFYYFPTKESLLLIIEETQN